MPRMSLKRRARAGTLFWNLLHLLIRAQSVIYRSDIAMCSLLLRCLLESYKPLGWVALDACRAKSARRETSGVATTAW